MAESPQTQAHHRRPRQQPMVSLLGPGDELLRVIEQSLPGADIHVRGNEITLTGEPGEIALVERLLDELVDRPPHRPGREPARRSSAWSAMLRAETTERPADVLTLNILSNRGRTIRPKTLNQKRYVDAIDKHTIIFGIGPAGTGKTYLAMAKAVQALQAKQVNRIILTRPAVEAGERLGFLPGTLSEKIDPYLRPLYDALHDMIDPESIPKAAGRRAPSRSRRWPTCAAASLNDAFIILDEAQNTSPEQMKMFLTRLGLRLQDRGHRRRHPGRPARRHDERAAVVQEILDGVDDVAVPAAHRSHDVVRHRLVGKIVDGVRPVRRRPAGRRTPRRGRGDPPRRTTGRPMSIEVANESGVERRRPTHRRAVAGSCSTGCGCTRRPSCRVMARRRGRPWPSSTSSGWTSQGPTDVLAFPMDELRPGAGRRGARARACSATSCSARRSPSGRRRTAGHADRRRARAAHACTASCTCSATTTPSPRSSAEMFGLQDELLAAWRGTTAGAMTSTRRLAARRGGRARRPRRRSSRPPTPRCRRVSRVRAEELGRRAAAAAPHRLRGARSTTRRATSTLLLLLRAALRDRARSCSSPCACLDAVRRRAGWPVLDRRRRDGRRLLRRRSASRRARSAASTRSASRCVGGADSCMRWPRSSARCRGCSS